MLASALRTDAHCFRRLEPTDPAIVELREWSRLSEDLTQERIRLANRMREQLWRYYPQVRKAVDDDVAAPWALDLWRSLPTPRAGQRARAATLTRVLKQHRIRRLDAAALRERLRTPAVTLTPGAAEAAATHVRLVVERLALVNRQLDHVRRQLDRIVHQLVEATPADATDSPTDADPDPSDAAILLSMPGIGVGVLATLLSEGTTASVRTTRTNSSPTGRDTAAGAWSWFIQGRRCFTRRSTSDSPMITIWRWPASRSTWPTRQEPSAQ